MGAGGSLAAFSVPLSVTATDPSTSLVLPAGTFAPGATYTIRLTAEDGTGRVQADTRITTAAAPKGLSGRPLGELLVTPLAGVALSTPFTLTAANWLQDGAPLFYQFQYSLPNTTAPPQVLSTFNPSSTVTVSLPPGFRGPGSYGGGALVLQLLVRNAAGVVTAEPATATVTVAAPTSAAGERDLVAAALARAQKVLTPVNRALSSRCDLISLSLSSIRPLLASVRTSYPCAFSPPPGNVARPSGVGIANHRYEKSVRSAGSLHFCPATIILCGPAFAGADQRCRSLLATATRAASAFALLNSRNQLAPPASAIPPPPAPADMPPSPEAGGPPVPPLGLSPPPSPLPPPPAPDDAAILRQRREQREALVSLIVSAAPVDFVTASSAQLTAQALASAADVPAELTPAAQEAAVRALSDVAAVGQLVSLPTADAIGRALSSLALAALQSPDTWDVAAGAGAGRRKRSLQQAGGGNEGPVGSPLERILSVADTVSDSLLRSVLVPGEAGVTVSTPLIQVRSLPPPPLLCNPECESL